jgi:hypothetical protein
MQKNIPQLRNLLTVLFLALSLGTVRAQIRGTVVDADDGYGVPYANVMIPATRENIACDGEGNFKLPRGHVTKIVVSSVGYEKQSVVIPAGTDSITVSLKSSDNSLAEVRVKARRKRYHRKDNPAVELMRRVIAKKKVTNLENHDYYRCRKYQKITLSENEVDTVGKNRKPWYLNHLDKSPIDSTKLILPVTINEQITEHLYRKKPRRDLDIVEATRASGVNKIFQTGDMVNTMLKEVFQDVDINNDYIRMLQYPFPSPLGRTAISFFHFYIQDTVKVDRDSCYHVVFYPANQRDFGFKGELFITKDSDLHVKRCMLEIPKKSDVNFIDKMRITQSFEKLSDGQWILSSDDMEAEVKLLSVLPRMLVIRNTRIDDYDLNPIDTKLLRGKAPQKEDPSARIRNDRWWDQNRPMPLSKSEDGMDYFVYRLTKSKNFGWASIMAKMIFENFVETGKPGNKDYFDFGPVSTLVSHNFVDGYRFRLSGRTMADLNPHLFWKGFAAWGERSHKWYYGSEVTWGLNRKERSPFEYPQRNLTFETTYDLMSPADKYLTNNKDNIFESFRTQDVRQMYFYNRQKLEFTYETDWGLSWKASVKAESNKPTGDLHFLHLNDDGETLRLRTTEFSGTIRFNPNQTYINTKQRRWPVNLDSPDISLTHILGVKGLFGGQYRTNMTELNVYKRQWLGSWGYIYFHVIGRAQWNKVPFPLLCMPPVSLTYLMDANDQTFNLMRNMEFLNDRYVFWSALWDLNGKLFNRIPLIKHLKWREFIGIKGMWGHLTDKNNPLKNPGDKMLFQLPAESHIMSNQPYWEAMVGIHNIFKFFGVDYVRRLTYKDLPHADHWGIRFNFMMSF